MQNLLFAGYLCFEASEVDDTLVPLKTFRPAAAYLSFSSGLH